MQKRHSSRILSLHENPFEMETLPPELRALIFRFVLWTAEIDSRDHFYLDSLTPGLLLLSKELTHEASVIFYGENCFALRLHKHQIECFLSKIGRNAENMKRIHIDVNACLDVPS
jgi:hypothetical protein